MNDKQVKIIFNGEIREGFSQETVKHNLSKLLKIDADRVNQLFGGHPVTLKTVDDRKAAQKYLMALHQAGAVCQVESPSAASGSGADKPLSTKPEKPARPSPSAANEPPRSDAGEMVRCPACGYRQKPSEKCIMCGVAFSADADQRPPDPPDSPRPRNTSKASSTPLGKEMILTNIEYIPGREIVVHFGLVAGSTIRAKHIGRDIMAGLKNLVGGELKGYTELLQESREEAIQRMVSQARQLGANAVINIRFSTSSVAQGAAELYAYGTAVRVE